MNEPPELDTVLDVCEHPHRRIVLATLPGQQQSVPMNDLIDAIDRHNHQIETPEQTVIQIRTALHHVHLPKLAEAGFIRYDPDHQVVEPTAQVDRVESHLSAILAVDPEIPTT